MRVSLPLLLSTLLASAALAQPVTGPGPAGSGSAGAGAPGSAQGRTPVLTPVVTARHPHDRLAFTEGLQYLGDGVYIESTGQVGASGVRRLNLKTGRVLAETETPIATSFGEGVTVLGGVAYHLTWQDGVAFTFDAKTLRETGRYRYSGEGWGLTTDGRALIMSNGTSTLVWRDPKTFAVRRSVQVTDQGQPVKNLNELEYVQGQIYANVWLSDRIARIDPQTGRVTAWIDVANLTREASLQAVRSGRPLTFDDVPNGIAFIPERGTLLITGKRWELMFEVRVPGVKADTVGQTPRR
ncbi:glutaminyl-peptide cyclotransferase [Deinococcus koreensis]|uniref:Glutamine cyclotransferase n=1 Tax=Deinococcus koreensis TaxID=2054903 RepID=A0A2K3V0J9_9DEIO|nr:glutaminyl-peptide cyclotransferase [Deinococcus koreensis]PNY82316.1 glutamine cyclotransferase [Deinococcus koreensis]